jgi:hypothetical protein
MNYAVAWISCDRVGTGNRRLCGHALHAPA